ncbi:MAG: ABC transporter ATP-binding protein [Clostridiales bacterium]|nr:ABC transporter ATP-binding protein [Clostridiales bacterium]
MESIIKTKLLTKRYGRTMGIDTLNLNVEQGDVFGFIGPNGAGKSTTIRVLLGLINITSGMAEVFGLDVRKHRKEIQQRIGYMPSEASYYSGMKVKDVVQMSAKLRRTNCKREANRLFDRFDLDENRRVEDLSFGNKKKVSIVCALQHKPELIILDEPTSGLDPLMQKEFWDALRERHNAGATVFLSSHVLSEVQQYCKNIAIIREGRLVVQDSVEALSNSTARRVTLRGVRHLPLLPDGVLEQSKMDSDFTFLYKGSMEDLTDFLAAAKFDDLYVTEPEMEELFLHFYAKAGVRK